MNRWGHWPPALAIAALLAALVAASAASAPKPPSQPKSFGLSGSVSGLYPSSQLPMAVTITNPYSHPLDVLTIGASSTSSNKKGCAAGLVTSPGWSGRARIPSGATGQISVPVRLAAVAPQACVGATFTLSLTGTATRP